MEPPGSVLQGKRPEQCWVGGPWLPKGPAGRLSPQFRGRRAALSDREAWGSQKRRQGGVEMPSAKGDGVEGTLRERRRGRKGEKSREERESENDKRPDLDRVAVGRKMEK